MAKEVAIKIKVDGQDVNITKENVSLLSAAIQTLEDDLQSMGQRTKENAKAWDETKNALEGATDAYNNLTKAENENTDATIKNEEEIKSLGEQIGKLEDKMGDLVLKGQQNTEEYRNLAAEARKLRDAQEQVAIASTKTIDVMAGIPGPIGFVFGGIKSLQVGLKSAQSALGSFGKQFKLLDRAIASTGIGALIVLAGLLVGAIVKAVSSSKVFTEGMERLGKATEIFGKILEPVIDFIAGTAIAVIEGLAKVLLFLTGNLAKYNEEVADAKATKEFEKNVTYQGKLLEASAHKYDEFTNRKLQANQKYKEKKIELDKDETLSEQQKYKLMKLYREQADKEIEQAQKDREKKAADERKAARDKANQAAQERLAIEKDFQNRLRSFNEEQALMEIKDEQEKELKSLQFQYEAQLREIDQLKISEKKKQQLRDEANQSYLAKQKETNDKFIQQEKDKQIAIENNIKTLQQQIEDNNLIFIQDEFTRAQAAEELRYTREKKRLQELIDNEKTTEEERKKYRTLQEQNTQLHYQNLDTLDQNRAMATIEYESAIANARLGIAYQAAGLLSQLAGQNKKLQVAGLIAEKAVGVADVIVNTRIANAKALALSPATFGQPWVGINNVSAVLSVASIIAAAAKGISEINSAGTETVGGGGGSSPNLGRNYAQGGLISGPGGPTDDRIGINVSNGEAVMSAGAVSMFAPMLSMLNQMGGGAPFSRSITSGLPDNPRSSQPVMNSTPIFKTYVVESDLTSEQHKQARLKDLSTL